MTFNRCFCNRCMCQFVPPEVTANLAKAGVETAQISARASNQQRNRRKNKIVNLSTLTPSAKVGHAMRKIYDSQHEWEQRVELVRSEGDPVNSDLVVNKVYDYVGIVRDFFKKVLNRDSIDNSGMDLVLNVHFGQKYLNAFWDGDEMTFGDGDGEIFVGFADSLDVVAHELAHGVTQFTAGLEYKDQSGALNESFSDVFGTAITQFANQETADTADWLIGDEIMGPRLYGEALRSMKEPGTAYSNSLMGKDSQPSHMKDYYSGPKDNGGVHINSGIPNKAFYLTSMDIGTDKAVLIWYTALQRLTPTTDFNTAVAALVDSARLLVREGQVPCGSPQVVRAAFKAVGLPTV
ncbi:MAG TPA: peptidase M4 family protein [Leptolyngbyaceae cyanobacterium M33_DOE_097]|uniref:Neutral metalloproteinase n=1 Tax=Oscillatoriales cyanobacterium SpSt-418 TaxID=2282169 RepID=A0A7C3PHW6_9CYAN|nr:peptidase M4 family protein [Leptolyngbyaceae cyanobacterium M33_DOE_097]